MSIDRTFDAHANFLERYRGRPEPGSSSGTVTSWMADVIARTGILRRHIGDQR